MSAPVAAIAWSPSASWAWLLTPVLRGVVLLPLGYFCGSLQAGFWRQRNFW